MIKIINLKEFKKVLEVMNPIISPKGYTAESHPELMAVKITYDTKELVIQRYSVQDEATLKIILKPSMYEVTQPASMVMTVIVVSELKAWLKTIAKDSSFLINADGSLTFENGNLQPLKVSEWPSSKVALSYGNSVSTELGYFSTELGRTLPYVPKESVIRQLTYTHLKVGEVNYLEATNGNILIRTQMNLNIKLKGEHSHLIPPLITTLLAKLNDYYARECVELVLDFNNEVGKITLTQDGNPVATIHYSTINLPYASVDRIIPTGHKGEFTVDKGVIQHTLKLVTTRFSYEKVKNSRYTHVKQLPVDISPQKDLLEVNNNSFPLGILKTVGTLDATFNAFYLLTAVESIEDGTITLKYNENTLPFLIKTGNTQIMIMPMMPTKK